MVYFSSIPRILVVCGAFAAQLILEGTILALDVLPPYILRYFNSSNAEVTLFGAVLHGFSYLLGPVSGIIANRLGDRILLICCGAVAAISFVIGSLAQQVWQLVLVCAVVGISFGLASVPPVTVVSFHFGKRRNLVTSGTTVGGAVGGAIAPFILQHLLDYHPWQHCFYYLGAAVLQLSVCGALLVRPKHPVKESIQGPAASIGQENEGNKLSELERRMSIDNVHRRLSIACQRVPPEEIAEEIKTVHIPTERFSTRCPRLPLIVFLICSIFWHIGFDAFEIMPLRLTDEGFSGNIIPLAISLHAMFDILGRLLAALLVGKLDVILTYNIFLLAGGVCRLLLSWNATLIVYLIYIAISGSCFGVVKAAAPSVLLELVGVKHINTGFGLWLLVSGVGGTIGPPLAGLITDLNHNDYFLAFFVGACLVLISTVPMFVYHWPMKLLFFKK